MQGFNRTVTKKEERLPTPKCKNFVKQRVSRKTCSVCPLKDLLKIKTTKKIEAILKMTSTENKLDDIWNLNKKEMKSFFYPKTCTQTSGGQMNLVM